MRHLDRKELSECNGQDGRAAYVAREGKVYDVSESKMWKGGSHMKLHQAGKDLTAHFPHAPHGAEVFERYPQIGVLKLGQAQRELPGALSTLLKRMPSLRRHPHPMTVHFPIVFFLSLALFDLNNLYSECRKDKRYQVKVKKTDEEGDEAKKDK